MLLKTEYTLNEKNIFILKNIINQETGEVLSIDSVFFDSINYVDDLDKFGLDIARFLLQKRYKSVSDLENLKDKQFFISYANGTISQLVVRINSKNYRFINFTKKFGCAFGDLEENQRLINFSKEIGADANSLGSSAYNFFLKTILPHNLSSVVRRKIMRKKDFVIFDDRITNNAKKMVSGFQFVRPGIYEGIYSYDQTSAYPSELLDATPTGPPLHFSKLEDVPPNYWFCVKIYAQNIKVKFGFDWLELKNDNKAFRYLYLTKDLYELLLETYDGNFVVREILAFKTTQRRFDKFVEETIIKHKINATSGILSDYSKKLGNSLIGYFGRNTTIENVFFKKCDDGFKFEHSESKREPLYLPIYLYCNGRQKADFIRTINKFKDDIIYVNTDGFFTTKKIDLESLNYRFSGPLGKFKLKEYKKINIKGINNYVGVFSDGSLDNCLAGRTLLNPVTLEDYENDNYSVVMLLCNHNLYIEKNIIQL